MEVRLEARILLTSVPDPWVEEYIHYSSTISDVFRPSRVKFPYTDILDGIQGSSGFQRRVLIQ